MPRPKVFTVNLSAADHQVLSKVTAAGTHPARMIMRARVLLELDENTGPVADRAVIAHRVGVAENTVRAIAKRLVETGGDVGATIGRKQRQTPPVPPIVTGEVEARLVALACSTPPEGHARWSLRLLERHVALAEELPGLDHSTIGRVLKKRNCVLTRRSAGPSRRTRTPSSRHGWRTCWPSMRDRLILAGRWCAWTRSPTSEPVIFPV